MSQSQGRIEVSGSFIEWTNVDPNQHGIEVSGVRIQFTSYSSEAGSRALNDDAARDRLCEAVRTQHGNTQPTGLAANYYGTSGCDSTPAYEKPHYQRVPPDLVQYPESSRPWEADGQGPFAHSNYSSYEAPP